MSGFEAPVEYLPWATQDDIRRIQARIEELSKELERRMNELNSIKASLTNEVSATKVSVDELRKKIEETESAVGRIKHELESLKATIVLGKMVGEWKGITCTHSQQGVCTAWRLGTEVSEAIKKTFGEDAVSVVEGITRVNVAKVPTLCAFCPLYKPKHQSKSQNQHVTQEEIPR